jgi:FMN-dependent NADH-azoreductase
MKPTDIQASQSGLRVLLVNSSSRIQDSVTRHLTEKLVEELRQTHGISTLTVRDVAAAPLPVIDESWVMANFTAEENRDEQQRNVLAQSDTLVAELKDADIIILGVPIYNFSVPAALKAWIDQVARAGLTFRYTSDGPIGLLEGKQAFVAVASGGVPIDSAVDFTTPYLRHVLSFIGIKDVKIIAAERMNVNSEASQKTAEQQAKQAVSSYNHQQTNAA